MRMISQGASEINMSFMINEESDVEEAMRSLHKNSLPSRTRRYSTSKPVRSRRKRSFPARHISTIDFDYADLVLGQGKTGKLVRRWRRSAATECMCWT